MKFPLLLVLIFFGVSSRAQESYPQYKISAGVGFPNVARYNSVFRLFAADSAYKTSGVGPYHFKFEYRVKWWLGVGLNVNHAQFKISYIIPRGAFDPMKGAVPNKVQISSNSTAFNCRANIYFINPDNHDTRSEPYVGMGIGYKHTKYKVESEYPESTPSIQFNNFYKMGLEFTLGYRYNFTENIAAYTELGIAKSIIQGGLTVSF